MRRAACCLAAALAMAGLASCARAPTTEQARPEILAAPAPPPVDHLAPGELAEGLDHAFGLTLPQDLHVDRTFPDVVYASGDIGLHPLAKYLRTRLEGGSLDEGDVAATFSHVRWPGRPGRELHVHIAQARSGVAVELRDSTPPPAPDLPDEAARWRAVGMTPNGKLLDPVHVD